MTPGADDLQFQTAETVDQRPRCSFCQSVLIDNYYQIAGANACAACAESRQAAQSLPDSAAKFGRALLFGGGAALAGLIIWSTVQIVFHIQIGLLAIAVGWMVGAAIRKATAGHSSRKYQFLAVGLTYMAIAMSFLPLLVAQSMKKPDPSASAPASGKAAPGPVTASEKPAPMTPGGFLAAIAVLLGLCAISPFLEAFYAFPGGLISLFILYLALQRAWTMTQADDAPIMGPYPVQA